MSENEHSPITNALNTYVVSLRQVDRSWLMIAGGKATNLGELAAIKDISVPDGFCITTEAYKRVTKNNREIKSLLDELARLKANERENISVISEKVRGVIEAIPISAEIEAAIVGHLAKFDDIGFCCPLQCHGGRSAHRIFCGSAGYVSKHHREGCYPQAYQQVLGIIVYR
jgi:hypothetical protein